MVEEADSEYREGKAPNSLHCEICIGNLVCHSRVLICVLSCVITKLETRIVGARLGWGIAIVALKMTSDIFSIFFL